MVTRIMHEPPAATADVAVLPGGLGTSFDRLRTSSLYDVLIKYASGPNPCGCPLAQPSPRSRCGVSCIMRVKILSRTEAIFLHAAHGQLQSPLVTKSWSDTFVR